MRVAAPGEHETAGSSRFATIIGAFGTLRPRGSPVADVPSSKRGVKVVADVALFARNSVLLVRYADVRRYDGERGWFLPDDFLVRGEHPDGAARRILRKQVGLTSRVLALGFVESFANGAWHIIFHYAGTVGSAKAPRRGENVAEARWFPLANLPAPADVAHHGWALQTIASLRERG
jgi:ADP-ribose pyrophosphatase YjhB (NUDIX family)